MASIKHKLGATFLLLAMAESGVQAFLGPVVAHSYTTVAAASTSPVMESQDRASLAPKLFDWYSKNGIKDISKVCVGPASQQEWGMGLVATAPIKRGEQIATIPLTLCLSMDSVRLSPVGKAVGGFEPTLGEASLIALQLLYEASLGPKSKYAVYIQSLPREGQDGFDHPLFWSPAEQAILAKSSTRNLQETLIDAVAADFSWIECNILARGAVVGLGADAFDLATYEWAVAVVLSRSFFADNGLRLAPLLDMANRGEGCQNEPEVGGLGIFGGKGLKIAADRDTNKGQEIVISYGPKSGIEFLEDHGFVPPPVAGNVLVGGLCALTFELSKEEDRFFDDKEDVMSELKLPMAFSFDVRSDGDVDPEMLQFLRFLNLGGKDAFLLEAVFRNEVWSFMEAPVSEENEQKVDNMIIQACTKALADFEEAEKLSENMLKTSGVSPLTIARLESLTRVRESEKGALEATQAWANRDLMTGDLKVYYQERRLEELQLSGPLMDNELMDNAGGRRTTNLDW
ncbi:ribulose-bisphosphate carboxylase oxygenase large subunit n-chloroplastic-like [Nannochloropsis oceanica]